MNTQSFIKKIFHYSKRIQTLGIKKSSVIALQKIQKKYTVYSLRKRALKGNFTWSEICNHQKMNLRFEQFWNYNCNNDFLKNFEHEELFQRYLPPSFKNREYSVQQAELILQNTFTILGCTKTFSNTIPWHTDIKNNYTFDSTSFYQVIQPNSHEANSFDDYFPDIKVPWELSRMNHLFLLGKAYELTLEEKYAHYFQNHVTDWIEKNPFLLGVNWVCPMDVGLRALNLIWGWYFFKKSGAISITFWEQFCSSVYSHAYYLEHNWENFPPTSNHYLSDLIGYFYICFFFDQFSYFKKQKQWCYEELLKEFDIQIQTDGTSYEGSTHYHSLITELYLHFYIVCKTNNVKLPETFEPTLKKMFQFISDTTDAAGNKIYIGDMDGGKIVTGIEVKPSSSLTPSLVNYKNFGLTIIKDDRAHITFRNHCYNQQQPSGHFHEDDLSITLSMEGIPILSDPGSYLYTANSQWRNFMRASSSHNGPFQRSIKNDSSNLFTLKLENDETEPIILCEKNIFFISNSNKIGKRLLQYDSKNSIIIIEDIIFKSASQNSSTHWNYVFHPCIQLHNISQYSWHVIKNGNIIAYIESNINFEEKKYFFSKSYGEISQCKGLKGSNESTPKIENYFFLIKKGNKD